MVKFVLLLLVMAAIGTQLGIIAVLQKQDMKFKQAFVYSTLIYLTPIFVLTAHIKLYNDRHRLLKQMYSKGKLTKVEFNSTKPRIDSIQYMLFSIYQALKDLVTPNDNISVILNFAIENKTKKVRFRKRKNTFKSRKDEGVFGMISPIIFTIAELMKENAKDETIDRKFAH